MIGIIGLYLVFNNGIIIVFLKGSTTGTITLPITFNQYCSIAATLIGTGTYSGTIRIHSYTLSSITPRYYADKSYALSFAAVIIGF